MQQPLETPGGTPRASWWAVLCGGVILAVAAVLPFGVIVVDGFRGGGLGQVGLDESAQVALVPDLWPASAVYLIAVALLLVLAGRALRNRAGPWSFVVVLVAAVIGTVAVMAVLRGHILELGPREQTTISCGHAGIGLSTASPCASALFGDHVDALQRQVLRQGFTLVTGNAGLRPKLGERIIQPLLIVLALLAGFQVLRLRYSLRQAITGVLTAAAAIYVLLLLLAIPPT